MTKTYHDIEAVTRLLQEKEKDLELAAKIGQELLERNKTIDDRVASLENQLTAQNELITQLRHELQVKTDLLHVYTNDLEDASPLELKNVNVELLQKQIKGLEEDNKRLHEEASQLAREAYECEEKEERLVSDAVKHLTEANLQISNLSSEYIQKTDESYKQKEEITYLLAKVCDLQAKCKRYERENEDLSANVRVYKETQDELTGELADFKEKYREIVDLLHDTQEELKQSRKRTYPGMGQHNVDKMFPQEDKLKKKGSKSSGTDNSLLSEIHDSLKSSKKASKSGSKLDSSSEYEDSESGHPSLGHAYKRAFATVKLAGTSRMPTGGTGTTPVPIQVPGQGSSLENSFKPEDGFLFQSYTVSRDNSKSPDLLEFEYLEQRGLHSRDYSHYSGSRRDSSFSAKDNVLPTLETVPFNTLSTATCRMGRGVPGIDPGHSGINAGHPGIGGSITGEGHIGGGHPGIGSVPTGSGLTHLMQESPKRGHPGLGTPPPSGHHRPESHRASTEELKVRTIGQLQMPLAAQDVSALSLPLGSVPGRTVGSSGDHGGGPTKVSGQLGSIPGQLGSIPGQLGSIPGQLGSIPGHLGAVPGQLGSVPGLLRGSSSGHLGSVPGHLRGVSGPEAMGPFDDDLDPTIPTANLTMNTIHDSGVPSGEYAEFRGGDFRDFRECDGMSDGGYSAYSEVYSEDVDFPALEQCGIPEAPGAKDLQMVLATLNPEEVEKRRRMIGRTRGRRRLLRQLQGYDLGSDGWDTPSRILPYGVRTPDSIMSTGSREWGSASSYHGWKLPDKLRIVKPLEGSLTLHQWSKLAVPHLGGILEERVGVAVKGGALIDECPIDMYHMSDLDEEDDEDMPQTQKPGTYTSNTLTNCTVLHPDDLTHLTSSYSGLQMASGFGSTTSSRPASRMSSRMSSRRDSVSEPHFRSGTSTFSTQIGLARVLNERNIGGIYGSTSSLGSSRHDLRSDIASISSLTPSVISSPKGELAFSPTGTPLNSPARVASPPPGARRSEGQGLVLGFFSSLRTALYGEQQKEAKSMIKKKKKKKCGILEKVEEVGVERLMSQSPALGSSASSRVSLETASVASRDSLSDFDAVYLSNTTEDYDELEDIRPGSLTMSSSLRPESPDPRRSDLDPTIGQLTAPSFSMFGRPSLDPKDLGRIPKGSFDGVGAPSPGLTIGGRGPGRIISPGEKRPQLPAGALGVPGHPGTGALTRPDLGSVPLLKQSDRREDGGFIGSIASMFFGRKGGLL